LNPVIDLSDLQQIQCALIGLLREAYDPQCEISGLKRCSVGFSWLTISFDLSAPGKEALALVLQIGPPNALLAPYSAKPQVLALESLLDSQVPVARPYWWSDDGAVFGAPFYVSQCMAGTTMQPFKGASDGDAHTHDIICHFIDVLAALHRFDWRAAPIATIYDGCTPADTAHRQVNHWSAAIDRWALKRYPMLDWATQWLRDNAPTAPQISIVHGDYRFGNFLRDGGRVSAVLDWEMLHFGDPHEDIGYACVPLNNLGSRKLYGMMPRDEVIERYEKNASFKVDRRSVRYYEVLAIYKQVAILSAGGFRAQAEDNADLRMFAMGAQVVPTLRILYRLIDAPL
jgi:aminoglycoside phosphotransferase (APT) family kinase protein